MSLGFHLMWTHHLLRLPLFFFISLSGITWGRFAYKVNKCRRWNPESNAGDPIIKKYLNDHKIQMQNYSIIIRCPGIYESLRHRWETHVLWFVYCAYSLFLRELPFQSFCCWSGHVLCLITHQPFPTPTLWPLWVGSGREGALEPRVCNPLVGQ